MNRIASILLVVIITLPSALKFTSVVNYLQEYDYYVNVLCENRDKPEMQCNGSCHLAKELKVAQNQTDPPEVPAEVKLGLSPFLVQDYQKDEGIQLLVSPVFKEADVYYRDPFLSVTVPPPRG